MDKPVSIFYKAYLKRKKRFGCAFFISKNGQAVPYGHRIRPNTQERGFGSKFLIKCYSREKGRTSGILRVAVPHS